MSSCQRLPPSPCSSIQLVLSSKDPIARPAGGGSQTQLQVHLLEASTDRDFDTAFARLVQLRSGWLVISSDSFFERRSEQLATLATRYAVPAICGFRAFATAGGLMSYGASITDAFRWIGVYTGRVLKGEKPADLPVQ